MYSWKKGLFFGLLTWLVPFVVSFFFYSKDGAQTIDIFLFKSIMIVVSSLTGCFLLVNFFQKVQKNFLKEGIVVGLVWLAINYILDLIILLPMSKLTVKDWFFQIGLRYLIIPIVSITLGSVLEKHKKI